MQEFSFPLAIDDVNQSEQLGGTFLEFKHLLADPAGRRLFENGVINEVASLVAPFMAFHAVSH